MTYKVYVIENLSGRFYIGLSEDVHHRLTEHNAGDSRWTKGKGSLGFALDERSNVPH